MMGGMIPERHVYEYVNMARRHGRHGRGTADFISLLWRLASDGFAEWDGHFIAAVGEGARASDLTDVAGEVAVLDVDPAGLADGEGASEEEGDAAEGQIASLDVVNIAGAASIQYGQRGPALDGFSVV